MDADEHPRPCFLGLARFDPSYEMAVSFQRLLEGKHTKADMILLRHEHLERAIERRYNYENRKAHDIVNAKYDYLDALKKEADKK